MKSKEKKLARELRQLGWSMNDIQKKLNVSKSSVSQWVQDIELTKKQKQRLTQRGVSKEVIEKRRKTRLQKENARRQIIIDKAKRKIKSLSRKDLLIIGAALYWAEGSKTQRGVVQFSNSDPQVIMVMMNFFRKVCKVPEGKFRARIHTHSHLNALKAKRYWSSLTKIPPNQFYKTYIKKSKASKNKRDSLPLGTLNINICITELFLTIKGWIERIYEINIK